MGQRVRVTVQLSDAANSTQLWSEQYDDELSDIFAVQERIARRVAGTLASSLQQIALQQACASRPTISTPTTCCCAPARWQPIRRAPAIAWRARCWSG